jgi:hypothetical protein
MAINVRRTFAPILSFVRQQHSAGASGKNSAQRAENKKTPGAARQPGVISSGELSRTVKANPIASKIVFRRQFSRDVSTSQ